MNQYIKDMLVNNEGVRRYPYKDTVGKITIGIGRNLDDVGLSMDEIDYLFQNDLKRVEPQAKSLPWYSKLNEARQAVILDMIFNLGIRSFLGFTTTISLIEKGQYSAAADQMLKSKWASQVGDRAKRLSEQMRLGVLIRR
jgi:lysozyme